MIVFKCQNFSNVCILISQEIYCYIHHSENIFTVGTFCYSIKTFQKLQNFTKTIIILHKILPRIMIKPTIPYYQYNPPLKRMYCNSWRWKTHTDMCSKLHLQDVVPFETLFSINQLKVYFIIYYSKINKTNWNKSASLEYSLHSQKLWRITIINQNIFD